MTQLIPDPRGRTTSSSDSEQLLPSPVPTPLRAFIPSALEHHDYGELDHLCTCAICVDWRTQLNALLAQRALCPSASPRTCRCPVCRHFFKAQSVYLAALHRRDLYCESSYHASLMSPRALGESFMSWLFDFITDRSTRTDGWWIERGSHYPLGYWQTAFRREMLSGDRGLLSEPTELPLGASIGALLAETVVAASGLVSGLAAFTSPVSAIA